MSPSFRKPRPLGREEGRHRDSSIIVIACEDTYIQRSYFGLFRSTRIQVRVIETPKDAGSSSPDAVLRRLCAVREEFDWEEGKDEFWLSIDKDRWKPEVLAMVYKEARQKGFNVALSNPCFEYWLLLHGIEPTAAFPNCQAAKDLLKARCNGYTGKTVPEGWVTTATLRLAIQRAKPTDKNRDGWPTENGTQVYRLAERLLALGADVLPGAR